LFGAKATDSYWAFMVMRHYSFFIIHFSLFIALAWDPETVMLILKYIQHDGFGKILNPHTELLSRIDMI